MLFRTNFKMSRKQNKRKIIPEIRFPKFYRYEMKGDNIYNRIKERWIRKYERIIKSLESKNNGYVDHMELLLNKIAAKYLEF